MKKIERQFPYVIVTKKCERFLKDGHLWVYEDEVLSESESIEDGAIVDVFSQKAHYLGSGYFNRHSKIRVRVISKNANDRFDEAFYRRRLAYAVDYRLDVMGEDASSCRLIFGEADGFPGLTVDRFSSVLVTQTLCLGIEKIKPMLFSLLIDVLKERGITITSLYERNDVSVREKEGLKESKGFFPLEGLSTDGSTEIEIEENGLKFLVDIENGQKTGYFLDQKYNRKAVSRLSKDKVVLDCFTHTGAFALNAAKVAKHVTAVDISEHALETAKKNAALNGLDNITFKQANVFELLTETAKLKKREFDLIVLDPPAFTKSRATVKEAFNGYKEINLKAMRIIKRGGILATCSCSHFMKDELFQKMLLSAAKDANVSLRQIEARQQAPDHPILWGVEETDYLKFYLFQVV